MRNAMDAQLLLTKGNDADGKAVWSRCPDAGVKLREHCLRSDGGKRARSPGRARRSLLTPSRRECRVISGEPVVTNACATYKLHTRLRVPSGIRHSLRPLIKSGTIG